MRNRSWCALAALSLSAAASAQQYQFSINQAPSGIAGSLSLGASTIGTLIGNYEPSTNPTGTRTKPGLFGTFGETENVAVNTTLGASIGGNLNSDTSGGFLASLNTTAGLISIEGYSANFLASGAINLPATLNLGFDSFRTRNPTSTYIGGIPLSIPFGQASLTQFFGQQVGSAAGAINKTGPGTFDFTVTPLIQLTAEFSILGNTFTIPGAPTPLLLQGSITLTGNTAQLVSIQPLQVANSVNPNTVLPQIPLDLPTILPPGGTASVLFDLTLSEVSAGVDTTLTTSASGVLVPSPAAASLLALAGLLAPFRRRSPHSGRF